MVSSYGGAVLALGRLKRYERIEISHTSNIMSIVPPSPESPAPNEFVSEETLHFDYPGSDIALRSCDSHNFRVPKLYIVNSSPVLRKLIRKLRNVSNTSDVLNGEEQEPLPVVKLPESGATLYNLLTFIFPVIPILPSTSEKVMELLAVAQKYQMDSVLSHIRGVTARQDPPFIRPETAICIYFLAQKHQLHQEALQAARVTLRLPPMVIEELGDKLDFPGMTGAYLHALWKYHERVRIYLTLGLFQFRESDLPDDVIALRCQTSTYSSSYGWHNGSLPPFPPWLSNYINSIADAPHLFHPIEFEDAWARHIQEKNRSHAICTCADISTQVLYSFWEALTAFVHGTIEEVRRIGVTRLHCDN